jgi:D-alanyl-D-alanine carboxypeptidase/D-alanyl-D-alanine-endopeptidase (penicillin-binding protein 4)
MHASLIGVVFGVVCRATRWVIFLALVAVAVQPVLAQVPAKGQAAMASAVARLIDADPVASRAHWGIAIVDAATGEALFARNAEQLFEPASNAKLFTTSAALALLGPGYTLDTEVLAEGTVDAAGTLHGDLRLVGGGDPTLSGRAYPYAGRTERPNPPLAALDQLAQQVASAGIHAVDGPVVADDTLFPDERYGHGWAWDDLQWEYGAPISALPINDDVRYLTVTPGAALGDPVTASWLPDVPGLPSGLDITATTSAEGSKPALGVARLPGSDGLRVYGTQPAGGASVHLGIALQDPALFAGQALRAALANAGVAVQGGVSASHRAPEDTESFTMETHEPVVLHVLPAGADSLAAAEQAAGAGTTKRVAWRVSVPLSDIVTVTNKVSQNLHAELLLRLLGRAEGSDGTAAQGARVVRAFANEAGVLPDDFLLYDGSGLSSDDLVTPRALTTLLRYSTTQPWGTVLRSSLPIAGVDGTLSARFAALRGRLQAKTGTLGEVDALSGFLTANSGRLLIISVLTNDHPGAGGRATLDGIVTAAAQAF